jgi:uncharacterized radical SAM superfamily Fe-S cluster-containing enzyme
MAESAEILRSTSSVCPVCLQKIAAWHEVVGDDVYLRKTCRAHGDFSTVVWRGYRREPAYEAWRKPRVRSFPQVCLTETAQGCPYDCGLCPDHEQQTCCILLEVTGRCNLRCDFCFAGGGADIADPPLPKVKQWLELLRKTETPFLHLSGGEPTVRDDLPDIIRLARDMGFAYIQLNTNGVRLARETDYGFRLKEAGLSAVFMQFDATADRVYRQLRGQPLLADKTQAIQNCAANGLGVVLVPTLVPGINTDDIGGIIRFGLARSPAVRGIHFQPVSYLGKYPESPADSRRLTLPEVIRSIAEQTDGLFSVDQFAPSGCDHARCGFHGDFVIMPDGRVRALTRRQEACCAAPCAEGEAVRKNRNFVARRWVWKTAAQASGQLQTGEAMGEWDNFITRVQTHGFSITAMAFQDCWTLDLDRLRQCSLHVLSQEGKIVPFCAHYLTSMNGRPIYNKRTTGGAWRL